MAKSLFLSACFVLALMLPQAAWSQVSDTDRAEIVRLAQQRGGSDADIAPIVEDINAAARSGLPQAPVINKVKEGLAKGVPPQRVHVVAKTLLGDLERARDVLGAVAAGSSGGRAIVTLGEAFFRGVTRDEVVELQRLLQQGGAAANQDRLAVGAQTWATLREGGVASGTGLPLVADAVRRGMRDAELARMAREAIAARQTEVPARPLVQRPAIPERPTTQERPLTPERPQRPERR